MVPIGVFGWKRIPKLPSKLSSFFDEIMGLLRDNDGGESSFNKALFLGWAALGGWAGGGPFRFP